MNAHDLGYAKLFSHALMIQDLVEGFVHDEWVSGLDFSTLEKVNPIYVTDDFRKRIDDLVWKIRWQGTNRWLYISAYNGFRGAIFTPPFRDPDISRFCNQLS